MGSEWFTAREDPVKTGSVDFFLGQFLSTRMGESVLFSYLFSHLLCL